MAAAVIAAVVFVVGVEVAVAAEEFQLPMGVQPVAADESYPVLVHTSSFVAVGAATATVYSCYCSHSMQWGFVTVASPSGDSTASDVEVKLACVVPSVTLWHG